MTKSNKTKQEEKTQEDDPVMGSKKEAKVNQALGGTFQQGDDKWQGQRERMKDPVKIVKERKERGDMKTK